MRKMCNRVPFLEMHILYFNTVEFLDCTLSHNEQLQVHYILSAAGTDLNLWQPGIECCEF